MSGTNFPGGVGVRTKYTGVSHADTDVVGSKARKHNASTKFVHHTAVIRCNGADADAAERTTNFTFPTEAIVKDVYINVITADTGETVQVGTEGTSNDPNGFLEAVSLATTGIVKGTLLDAGVTLGALLFVITEATTAASKEWSVACGGDPVSFTCSSGTDTAVFDIIIEYVEVVNEVL